MTHTDWYDEARSSQEKWKSKSPWIPAAARKKGRCMIEEDGKRQATRPSTICFPLEYADLNLLPSIRSEAINRFNRHNISWHFYTDPTTPGTGFWPSPHLLDSQVQCVNALLSTSQSAGTLLKLMTQIEPDARAIVPIEDDSPVAFEWIGIKDYLEEERGTPRIRGKHATSIDALIVVERAREHGRTGILLEWKFTESYEYKKKLVDHGWAERREAHRKRFEASFSPFVEGVPLDDFFYEPYYQFMRQHLLASAMVEAREFGIDRAIVALVLHPKNDTLWAGVPAPLQKYGTSLTDVWGNLIRKGTVSFKSIESTRFLKTSHELRHRYLGYEFPSEEDLQQQPDSDALVIDEIKVGQDIRSRDGQIFNVIAINQDKLVLRKKDGSEGVYKFLDQFYPDY